VFQLIYQQLDQIYRDKWRIIQLCLFIGSEGGIDKSYIIKVVVELFFNKEILYRLFIIATSGIIVARINGITIYSTYNFSKKVL